MRKETIQGRALIGRGASILLANILICGILLIAYSLNFELGQAISLIVAGFIFGSIFAIVAWLFDPSQINDLEKRNLLVILYVIMSVAIFWLAAVFGDGSIFKLHKLRDFGFMDLVFAGGIFGLMMGFGVLFDYALLNKTPLSRLALFVSFLGFAMIILWYFPTGGLLFVVSVIIARIAVSILMNRMFAEELKDQVMTIGISILSLILIVLPWAAFLSR